LLRNFSEQPVLTNAIPDNRFNFPQLQERLKGDLELDSLTQSLDHDYKVISYLLNHAPGLGSQSVEERLLVLDYRVMQGYYRVTRTMAPLHARRALLEMASVLGVLAQRIGEQAGIRNEA
jgi:hypothetical protein